MRAWHSRRHVRPHRAARPDARLHRRTGLERYHDPKSLLLALVGEVGELAELFQWLPADQARALAADEPLRTRAGEELADVLLYLIRLADILDVDLPTVARAKMRDSHTRFPTTQVHGRAPTKA